MNIINNEYEGMMCFKQAQIAYGCKLSKKSNSGAKNSEESLFGENMAATIVIISAQNNHLGQIIHTNEEIESLLGYQRNEVIGKNVALLMPTLVGNHHNGFIQHYLDTGKKRILEQARQFFAVNKKGNLEIIEILVKINPDIQNQILFVGMMQRATLFKGMEPPKQDLQCFEQHYILTDERGFITNITEGLYCEMGLHPRLFRYQEDDINSMINIEQLCDIILEPDAQQSLENECGQILPFNTANILGLVELEKLSQEDLEIITKLTGTYNVYVQMKPLVFGSTVTVHIYRLILVNNSVGGNGDNLGTSFLRIRMDDNEIDSEATSQQLAFQSASMSSTSSTGQTFDSVLKNFKQSLGEKHTPGNLVMLNRVIGALLVSIMVLSIIDFIIMNHHCDDIHQEYFHNIVSEMRTLEVVYVASNARSLINLGNKLEYDKYETVVLNRYDDRFEYLGRQMNDLVPQLQDIHNFMTQQRVNEGSGNDQQLSNFDYEPIQLFRLDYQNEISTYQIPYRVALSTFLNKLQDINETTRGDLYLPEVIQKFEPIHNSTDTFPVTTATQKNAFWIIANGLRSIRLKTMQSTKFQQSDAFGEDSTVSPFIIIMIIGVLLTTFEIVTSIYQIWMVEQIQIDILSIYAHLQHSHVKDVFNRCSEYMEELNDGSFFNQIKEKPSLNQNMDIVDCLARTNQAGDSSNTAFKSFKMTASKGQQIDNHLQEEIKDESSNNLISFKPSALPQSFLEKKLLARASRMKNRDIFKNMMKRILQEISIIKDPTRNTSSKSIVVKKKSVKSAESTPIKKQTTNDSQNNLPFEAAKLMQKQFGIKFNNKKEQTPNKYKKTKSKNRRKDRKQQSKDNIDESSNNDASRDNLNEERTADDIHLDDEDEESNNHKNEKSKEKTRHLDQQAHQRKSSSKLSREYSKTSHDSNTDDQQEFNAEQRRTQFRKTMKTKNFGRKLVTVLLSLVVGAYFIQLNIFQNDYESQFNHLVDIIPVFFNRYRYLMLSYSLLRERIIFNNSLASFESVEGFGNNLDQYYYEESMKNEQALLDLNINHFQVTEPLIQMIKTHDSPDFCNDVIGEVSTYDQLKDMQDHKQKIKISAAELRSYQNLISTVIAACRAAFQGDIATLHQLKSKGVDLSQGDYDKRTPLHFAVRGKQNDAVRFLISAGVQVNVADRWGSTPMNYAQNNTEIFSILKANGGIFGEEPIIFHEQSSVNLTDNDIRLFYAALYNDIKTAEVMFSIGWRVNQLDIDMRAPIHIAAVEGHLQVLQFLAENGADLTLVDGRGHNSMDEAENNGFIDCHNFIDNRLSDMIIKQNCHEFSKGLMKQGMHQVIGTFHKKFADFFYKVQSAPNFDERLKLLRGDNYRDEVDQYEVLDEEYIRNYQFNTIQIYQQVQELYFNRIIWHIRDKFLTTFYDVEAGYGGQTLAIFIVFIILQLTSLFVLRNRMMARMRADIFESRGILNLIPNHIIEQNKHVVEVIIKKLKD